MTHYVTYTPDPDQDPDDTPGGDLVFECDEPETEWCRWTSNCDCERFNVERDDVGTFHISQYETDEHGQRPRHDMYLDPDGCGYKAWWANGTEEQFRDAYHWDDDPLRPGRHQVDVTFDGEFLVVEYTHPASDS